MSKVKKIINFFFVIVLLVSTKSLISQSQDEKTTDQRYVCTPCNNKCDSIKYKQRGVCTYCNMPLVQFSQVQESPKIAFFLQDGVEILDFAGPMKVFAFAGYNMFTVSKSKSPITAQGVLKIIPDYTIEDAPNADILAFFGGNISHSFKDSSVIKWVKSQVNVEYYFSVCTGAYIMAEAGLLNNRKATTFHDALDNFEKNYPDIEVLRNVRYVDNGNIITTAGISAGIDGALHLVAKLKGFNTARKTANYMEYDKWSPGDGYILSGNETYKNYTDTDILKKLEGTYKSHSNLSLEIILNIQEKSLAALIENRKTPLFYINDNFLSTINDEAMIFRRTADGEIHGFEFRKNDVEYFSKSN